MVSAQISIYPLRQEHLTPAVEAVQQVLRNSGLSVEPGLMSTYVMGEDQVVFAALQESFARACSTGHVVMTVTLSNACPVPGGSARA
jgi:uncharacterized protein YqgV (UPF0045/DUF77 family)